MSDDFEVDKTMFQQPVPGGERTALRPAARRRGNATEMGRTRQMPAQGMSPQGRRPSGGAAGGGFESHSFDISHGLNPLVSAASTLIAVFEKTRNSIRHPDVGGLHTRLVNEIKQFENRAKDAGTRPEILLAARYLMCSALDEAVLHTPWGDESGWGQRTLLRIYHGETSGGEKCFAILQRMMQAPSENLHMLELFYVVLSLGFEGKYRLIDRGYEQLDRLRDDLYRSIRNCRGDHERSLSNNWQGLGHVRKTLSHYVPLWVAAAVFAVILFLSYGGFSYWMRSISDPVVQHLDTVAAREEKAQPPTLFSPSQNKDSDR